MKFHGNRSARFSEIRNTDGQTRQLYIIIYIQGLTKNRSDRVGENKSRLTIKLAAMLGQVWLKFRLCS